MKNFFLIAVLLCISAAGFAQTLTITNTTGEELTVGIQLANQSIDECAIIISENEIVADGDSWVYTIPPGPNFLVRVGASGSSGSGFVHNAPCGSDMPGPYSFSFGMGGITID